MIFILPSSVLFTLFLITRTIIAISSTNWLFAWISIEVNILSFIPIILQHQSNQEIERAIKYFLAQAMGSAVILYSRILLQNPGNQLLIQRLLITALLLKLGAAPCHFWFPSTITSISWINCLILCTWQKLGPLILLILPFTNSYFLKPLFIVAGVLNAILGGLLGINQAHIRTILAYSSITHIGWIIGSFTTNLPVVPIIYFSLYSAIIIPIFIILQIWGTSSFSQIPNMLINSFTIAAIFRITLLSLGGLPPLTGFIPKWLAIIFLRDTNWIIVTLLLLGSLINLYFYLNLTFNMLTISFIGITKKLYRNPRSLRLITVIAVRCLGVFPVILYAMTLLYKSQRYWHSLYSFWSLSWDSGNRNKTINSVWISSTRFILRQRSVI